MKFFTITICTTALLSACNNDSKTADDTKTKDTTATVASTTDKKMDPMPDSATMMKNWMNYMTPGKEQQMLAASNGTWAADISMWMAPNAPVMKSTGTTVNKMILGGRYQQSSHHGTFNGMPFEGQSTIGFDNGKKVFVSTWIDNMGTGIMTGEGTWDDASKSITIKGKMVDPGTGNGKEVDYREVFKIVDNDHQVLEMYGTGPDGKEFKSMEIKYTRKK